MLSSLSAITKEAVVGESVNPGAGNFTTVSVRGVDFAPKKQETLVPTPMKEGAGELPDMTEQEQSIPRRVGKAAMKVATKH